MSRNAISVYDPELIQQRVALERSRRQQECNGDMVSGSVVLL